jgi:hypothetical protein
MLAHIVLILMYRLMSLCRDRPATASIKVAVQD